MHLNHLERENYLHTLYYRSIVCIIYKYNYVFKYIQYFLCLLVFTSMNLFSVHSNILAVFANVKTYFDGTVNALDYQLAAATS